MNEPRWTEISAEESAEYERRERDARRALGEVVVICPYCNKEHVAQAGTTISFDQEPNGAGVILVDDAPAHRCGPPRGPTVRLRPDA